MQAGKLDRRIVLLRATAVRDAFNNEVLTWQPLAEVWNSWRAATAREQLASQETGASVEAVFEIRWSTVVSDLNPKDRLRFNGRDYDIIEATEMGRRKSIRIKATARSD